MDFMLFCVINKSYIHRTSEQEVLESASLLQNFFAPHKLTNLISFFKINELFVMWTLSTVSCQQLHVDLRQNFHLVLILIMAINLNCIFVE